MRRLAIVRFVIIIFSNNVIVIRNVVFIVGIILLILIFVVMNNYVILIIRVSSRFILGVLISFVLFNMFHFADTADDIIPFLDVDENNAAR